MTENVNVENVNVENTQPVLDSDTQKLIDSTLEEAEQKADKIITDANKEAEVIKSDAKKWATSFKETSKAAKNAKYIALTNIKENGKLFKVGEPYNGKNTKSLLESGAIRKN